MRMSSRARLALACFALSSLVGCESVPGTPTEASALCAEVAAIVCDADARCFGSEGPRASCLTAQREACDQSLGTLATDARLGYDPARAGAFLSSLEARGLGCWAEPADLDALLEVFRGTGPEGSECTPRAIEGHDLLVSSLACADGTACRLHVRIDGSPEGVCETRSDDACSHPWDCEAGSFCSLPARWEPGVWGECRPRRTNGWACTSDVECASLFCDGVCTDAPDDRLALEVDYAAVVLGSDPALYLRLNESSGARRDELGGPSAAASGGTVSRVAMGAIEGDGAAGLADGSFLRVAAPEALVDAEGLTLECWARPDDVSAVAPLLELADAMDYGPHVWAFDTGDELYALVEKTLLETSPGGIKVSLTRRGKPGHSWLYTPKGPAFEAADRAYTRAWGRGLLQIGVGGTIPFVALFGRRFGDLPLILNGVMDPETGAHGPNESMHLGVFEKAILANVHLYAELAEVPGLAR